MPSLWGAPPQSSAARWGALSGWAGRLNLAKQNGNLLVLANVGAISPGFDPNDAGFQYGGSDIINLQFIPGYQWTKPGKLFRYALVIGGWFRNYDFGGNRIWDGGLGRIFAVTTIGQGGGAEYACNAQSVIRRSS